MNTKQEQKQNAPPSFTAEDFRGETVYKYLYEISDPFKQEMEKDRLMALAAELKVQTFNTKYNAYKKSRKSRETKEPSENADMLYSDFGDQPYQIMTGKWNANDETGVWRIGPNNQRDYACSHMIMPVELIYGADTGRYKVKLKFRRNSRRKAEEIIVDIDKLSNATKIVDALTPFGVSVTSGSRAYALVDYIRDILDLNTEIIPVKQSVSRLGWNKDGFFPYTGKEIIFDGADLFRPIQKAIHQAGEPRIWLNESLEARTYSLTARIVLAASFAAPLIEPLGCSSFFVHLWGGSDTGKTVAQMLAAAVWAYPVRGGGFFFTFDSTNVGLERIAGVLHNFPLFLDETQQAKDKRGNVQFNLYNLTSESGRLRSNKELGLNYTPTWKTVFITSGEGPIVKETDGEGALNRAFEIECYKGVKVIKDGHKTAEAVKTSYGWAGKYFIEKLTCGESLEKAKSLYEDFFRMLLNNDTTEKQAMAAAAILTADALATEWIFKDGRALTVKDVSEFLRSRASVSLMDRSYQIMCDWVAENIRMLQGADTEDKGKVYGIVDESKFPGMACIISSVFNRVCMEQGIEPKPLLSHMKSAGLIQTGSRGNTMSTYIGMGQSVQCVRMKLPKATEESAGGYVSPHFDNPKPFDYGNVEPL